MQPARAFFFKDLLPINFTGLELRRGSVAAIGTTHGGANTETALGKVEPVAHRASYAVVFHPAHMALIHAALVHQIFHQTAHWIIGQRGHDRGAQSEAALQSAPDIVFSATLPRPKITAPADPFTSCIQIAIPPPRT